MLADLKRDVRYAIRVLIKNPGFTSVAVLTLALGIGATTAIFSLVGNILIRPLPYRDSDELVSVVQSYSQIGLDNWRLSPADFALYRSQRSSFTSLAAYWITGINLIGIETPERLVAAQTTADFFKVLGVDPILGRTFAADEDTQGRNNVCVLSYSFWERSFNKDRQVIGKVMVLNNTAVQVIGVMPEWFSFPGNSTEIWMPMVLNPQASHPYFLTAIARLKPGVDPKKAQSETTRMLWSASMQNPLLVARTEPPPPGADLKTVVVPLKETIVGKTATPLLILQSAVAFVLLIACANIANLFLTKTTARAREVALCYALGCTPFRVLKQLLTESLLLALCGTIPGVLLAWAGVKALGQITANDIPRIDEVGLNANVLFFALGVAVATGLLIGLLPALRTMRLGLKDGLNEAQRGSSERSGGWMKAVLVGGQLALSLVLLVGAGLVLKSLQRMIAVQPGFDSEKVLTMLLPVAKYKYPSPAQASEFYRTLKSELRAVPGVSSVSVTSNIPLSGEETLDGYIVEGHEPPQGTEPIQAELQTVSPDYFKTMGISLLRGRDFQQTDEANTPAVAIVDQTLANKFWPDGNALGKRIETTGDQNWMTIVGVVNGVKDNNLAEDMKPHLYFPHGQDPQLRMYLAVGTAGTPLTISSAIRNKIRELDPEIPVYAVRPLTDVIRQTLYRQKLIDGLLTSFALVALTLSVIGIYGVISIYVTSRTREFGIRLAVGAQPGHVLYSVLKQGLLLVGGGIGAGLIGSFLLTKTISSLLYNVRETDLAVYTVVPLLLAIVAIAACYFPARRAAKTDPVVALRYE